MASAGQARSGEVERLRADTPASPEELERRILSGLWIPEGCGVKVPADALARYEGCDVQIVRALHKAGADVNAGGGIALQRAAAADNEDIVDYLCHALCSVHVNHFAAFYHAGVNGNATMVRRLLGWSYDREAAATAAVIGAASVNEVDTVRDLFGLKGPGRVFNPRGSNYLLVDALKAAARAGATQIITLIDNIFTIGQFDEVVRDVAYDAPADALCMLIRDGIARGALDCALNAAVDRDMPSVLLHAHALFRAHVEGRRDALLVIAAAQNACGAARFLVECGARIDPTACVIDHNFSLMAAEGHDEMLALVLASLKDGARFAQAKLDDALDHALMKGHRRCAETLVAHGAAIEPARAFAIAKRDVDAAAVVAQLGKAGADIGRRISIEALAIMNAAAKPAPRVPATPPRDDAFYRELTKKVAERVFGVTFVANGRPDVRSDGADIGPFEFYAPSIALAVEYLDASHYCFPNKAMPNTLEGFDAFLAQRERDLDRVDLCALDCIDLIQVPAGIVQDNADPEAAIEAWLRHYAPAAVRDRRRDGRAAPPPVRFGAVTEKLEKLLAMKLSIQEKEGTDIINIFSGFLEAIDEFLSLSEGNGTAAASDPPGNPIPRRSEAEKIRKHFDRFRASFGEVVSAYSAGRIPAETVAKLAASLRGIFEAPLVGDAEEDAVTGMLGRALDEASAAVDAAKAATNAAAPKSAEEVLAAARAAHEAGDTAALKRILGV